MLVHTYLFWLVVRKLWLKTKPVAMYISSLAFVLLTSWPMLEGDIANAELFMMTFITAALLILLNTKEKQYARYFLAGLVGGLGLLFKIPVVFDFVALILFFLIFAKQSFWEGVKTIFRPQLWLVVLGFVAPFVVTAINYSLKGAGAEYIKAALLVNFGYVSSWETSSFEFDPLKSGLLIRGVVLILYCLFLYLIRKKLDKTYVMVLLWLGFSLFGALLSGRPYPHYLQQPVVPLALLIPFVFLLDKLLAWVVLALVIGLGVVVQQQIKFWGYPTLSVYQNFGKYVKGEISKEEYRNTFSSAKRNYAVAEYLKSRMREEDQIFIWGNDMTVYNLTKKGLVGGKYMVDFHVRDWQAFDEVMDNLTQTRPEYVLVLPRSVEFVALAELLDKEYLSPVEIEGVAIYRRIWEH
jgi:hypothetical protein